jgi:hypothetical protein
LGVSVEPLEELSELVEDSDVELFFFGDDVEDEPDE